MKQTILIPAMFIASCASAPEVKKTELGDSSTIQAIAKKRALEALLPHETYPHEGKQPDGTFVTCMDVDIGALEQNGKGAVAEAVAAEMCAHAARIHCTGSPSITEQQMNTTGRVGIGAGEVVAECVKLVKGGRILGDLKCRAEIGVYDEADGKGAAACASSEFMK